MKTADRLLLQVDPPFRLADHPALADGWLDSINAYRRGVASGPRLFADNVAAYVYAASDAGKGFVLEEFPCLSPPWPYFWIEYPNSTGRERRGVFVRDITDAPGAAVEGAGPAAIADARANGYEGEVAWLLEFALFIEGRRHSIIGPAGWTILALDPRGRCVGNRWVTGIPAADPRLRHFAEDRLMIAMVTAYQTLAFLHCRNVKVDDVERRPKLDQLHRKKHDRPLLRFQTVRLEVPRRTHASRGQSTPGVAPALHIVPGNFHHYGDCCPTSPTCALSHGPQRCQACGGHNPHGLLFGRLTGVYWTPQHARGNPERGSVRSDYDLQVKDG